MEDRRSKPPLLYIAQNQEAFPEVTSQSFYYSGQDDAKQDPAEQAKASSRSRFQSLSLDEKFQYILKMQETLPKLKCKILTKEGTINGVIEDISDEIVNVVVRDIPRRRALPKDIILDIQLIGF
ncbi:CotO family spore coat protein [Aquisalibacillus elongatus]|uniref:Spore coat protein CotO n=1 Tax=Aquisalibacillus elongatus TaxID=485577 RepID=A0A3N5B3Z4_9BACI|nr:CotO family spore coat protein [Aquisalibacillus elongatus]RPF52124.1 spore coat protein CotO [Aquisalibacillus elongatus]